MATKEDFWSNSNLEPKRNHKFVMYVGTMPYWIVSTADRPTFAVEKAEHKYLNHTFYFPGGITFEPISVTLVEPITSNSVEEMKNLIINSGYNWINPDAVPTKNDLNTLTKRRAVQAMTQGKGVKLEQINGDQSVVDIYTFKNPWISNVDLSQMEYGNYDLSNITLEITYDFAHVETRIPAENAGLLPVTT